jgi:hypothetical protein
VRQSWQSPNLFFRHQCPAISTKAKPAELQKSVYFQRKPAFLLKPASPISWGTEAILPLPVVLSRKFCKKVTQTIFPSKIKGISTPGRRILDIIRRGEQLQCEFLSRLWR